MSSISGYIGQAGTGKTTKLISSLNCKVESVDWSSHNGILALTFMHGSRRRLLGKLNFLREQNIKVECQTIDSFCVKIVHRYKMYLGINKKISISDKCEERAY